MKISRPRGLLIVTNPEGIGDVPILRSLAFVLLKMLLMKCHMRAYRIMALRGRTCKLVGSPLSLTSLGRLSPDLP
jgi:hypothetical protein